MWTGWRVGPRRTYRAVVIVAVTVLAGTVGLGGPAIAHAGLLTETPNPLTFPHSNPCVVYTGASGSVGASACAVADITITNGTSHAETITGISTDNPAFFLVAGGTCDGKDDNRVLPNHSCALEFGFTPTSSSTTNYTGNGTVSFASGAVVTFGLQESSN